MSGIKYYALMEGEELPEEFVVIKHVDGEPKFIASYINTNYLSYENGVLLKMHERNDVLRAENAKLAELAQDLYAEMITYSRAPHYNRSVWKPKLEAMGIEVPE